MEKKVEYVREHYSKERRKTLVEERIRKNYTLKRKKQRVWTFNRSPHGNKTAREQFGRQVWQRRVRRNEHDAKENRIKIKFMWEKKTQYVNRKEIETVQYVK